jgi:hypothetical protein
MADNSENKVLKVRLEIDGEKIPLKRIIQDIISGAVVGIVNPLKGVGDPKKIMVEIDLE